MTQKKLNRMSHAQYLQAAVWIKDNHKEGKWVTYTDAARAASETLKLHVNAKAVSEIYEYHNLKLEKVMLTTNPRHDRTQVLANELINLMRELGREPSQDLINISQRKGVSNEQST